MDPNRVNEFGTSGVEKPNKDSPVEASDNAPTPAAITEKAEEEKKND